MWSNYWKMMRNVGLSVAMQCALYMDVKVKRTSPWASVHAAPEQMLSLRDAMNSCNINYFVLWWLNSSELKPALWCLQFSRHELSLVLICFIFPLLRVIVSSEIITVWYQTFWHVNPWLFDEKYASFVPLAFRRGYADFFRVCLYLL